MDGFWKALDALVSSSELILDRPRGSRHPRFPEVVYELDYGYLAGTSSMDGEGVDVWRGSDPGGALDAVVCTVDPVKRDAEIKLLLGCTEEEKQAVCSFHSRGPMRALLIRRDRG